MDRVTSDLNNGVLTIKIHGDFDLEVYQDFHKSYPKDMEGVSSVVIDLSQTHYIDSPALGMLLMVRQLLGKERADITLLHPNDNVRELLEVAQFGQLMKIK